MRPSRRTKRKKVEEEEEAATVEVPSSRSPSASTQSLQQPEEEKLSLGLKLFRRREDDSNMTDMLTFSLESGSSSVPAHIVIVREGSSTLEEMIKRRRDKNSNGESTEIQVPKEVGATTFNSFLKFLYDEATLPAPGQLKDDLLYKLLLLADHFAVEELYNRCCSILSGKLKPQNCVEIFQTTLQLTKNELCDLAFQSILQNVTELMSTRNDEAMVEWNWKTWQCIFQLQRLSGEQLVLAFKALKRWREHDPTKRDEAFHRLGKCIRFRSFGSAAAADTLESTGILSQAEMVSLFMHFAGGHKTITVDPSQDLQDILNSCTPGSRVRLSPGTYHGMFVISSKDTKLIGSGPTSEIRGRLIVETDECEVADLSVVFTQASMSHEDTSSAVTTSGGGGGQPIIFIRGNSNSLNNVEILPESKADEVHQEQAPPARLGKRKSRGANTSVPDTRKTNSVPVNPELMSAILCCGNHNKLTNIITQLSIITITGDDNRVEVVQFRFTLNGIHVKGDSNIINDVMFFPVSSSLTQKNDSHTPESTPTESCALTISEGRENVVTNLNAFQVPPTTDLFLLKLCPKSASTRVRNCAGASVEINGVHHSLVGLKLSPRFTFRLDGAFHQLVDCNAEQFKNSGKDMTTTNCEFY